MPARSKQTLVAVAYTDLPSDARVTREASAAARSGLDVTLLVPQSPKASAFGIKDVQIEWLPVQQQRGNTTLKGQLEFGAAVRRWIRRASRPDVVHVHNMPDYFVWLVADWQLAGTRCVLDVHDIMSDLATHRFRGFKRRLAAPTLSVAEHLAWRTANKIITVHEGYRQQIVSRGVRGENVTVVLNAPDPAVCFPELRTRPPDTEFKIAFHGTISRRTGALMAIESMPHVLASSPHAQLHMIGAGDGLEEARRIIDRLDLHDHVNLTPQFLPLPEALRRIADAHIGLAPNEPSAFTRNILPVKLLEYATLGIPTVVTRLPLVTEYARDSEVRFLTNSDASSLASAISELASSEELRRDIGIKARELAERHHWRHYEQQLIRVLRGEG